MRSTILSRRELFLAAVALPFAPTAFGQDLFDATALNNLIVPPELVPELNDRPPITPANADTTTVTLFGDPHHGAYCITHDRDASKSVAQDVLNTREWDEVVVMKPAISPDRTSYTLEPTVTFTKTSFLGQQLGLNIDHMPMSPDGFQFVGLLGGRGSYRGSRRTFNDCRSCNQRSYSNCEGGDCNLRPLHIFTHQFQYAFRRAYPKGSRPGLRNRVLNLMFPRIRYRNGHISCYTAQTLLARRLILIEIAIIAGTAGAGGGAAGVIFIP